MRKVGLATFLTALALALAWLDWNQPSRAQPTARVLWIWHAEGEPTKSVPAGTRYFRKIFALPKADAKPLTEAKLEITADNSFKVWLNGKEVGTGNQWQRVESFDVKGLLVPGDNILAVEASNESDGPAGLMVRLRYAQPQGSVVSDGTWKSSESAGAGWQKLPFKDEGWKAVRVAGEFGKTAPWAGAAPKVLSKDRFTVPPGFRVELAVKTPEPDKTFSLVNMCFDARGRLLLSREGGAILLATEPDEKGVLQKVAPYCTQITNCQGMCWVDDALYLVGNGPKGTGLYRVRDTAGNDQIDEVTLLHRFQGGMGEHGPHAIIHGPDDWLYLVVGNHAWVKLGKEVAKSGPNPENLAANSPLRRWPTGRQGPDQGKPGTTEDVLLPRLNDARGHAANILAPGGTIWRLDKKGQNLGLFSAGYRNQFDAAFNPLGELFTYDSDMEWDLGLPWYRDVRICHATPGSDFVWRTGAANTPSYYLDSLPPLYETGRGSPVGVEAYDHVVFPEKYRGAVFVADWSVGIIYSVLLQRAGASYKAEVEKFCTGQPLNVTDLAVGPDGALWFSMGGRGSQGGVFRIVADQATPDTSLKGGFPEAAPKAAEWLSQNLHQPLAPYSRARFQTLIKKIGIEGSKDILAALGDRAARGDLKALHLLEANGHRLSAQDLTTLYASKDPVARAEALRHHGAVASAYHDMFKKGLKDADALVRRRACEAILRSNSIKEVSEPEELALIWPLLADKDRFVRHAARLVLERIDSNLWAERIAKEPNDLLAWNAIVALCHIDQATPHAHSVFMRLRERLDPKKAPAEAHLDHLRAVQLALIHISTRPAWVKGIAEECFKLFPHKDARVNRELAILLTQFQREGILDQPVQPKLLAALQASAKDRPQQIHYFYCLRLLTDHWTTEQKQALADWYENTRTWQGGASFTPFLENIFRECLGVFTPMDRERILVNAYKMPLCALVVAQRQQLDCQPELLTTLETLSQRLPQAKSLHRSKELQQAVTEALTRTVLKHPTPQAWPYLLRGVESKNPLVRSDALIGLLQIKSVKPKVDDPAPYRTLLSATAKLNPQDSWRAVQVLRQWSGREFGASDAKGAARELKSWHQWFQQSFPKEPALVKLDERPSQSKYQFKELLAYLEKAADSKQGNAARGRMVFEKANCLKCHKYGKEGEGVGPDLTAVSKRFKRADILEALLLPSKVISDQYRSVTITTTKGQPLTGLAAVQGDTVTLLLSDASRVMLRKSEIESQVASLISVMPEQLLDALTREEIADLFAFMEAEPK